MPFIFGGSINFFIYFIIGGADKWGRLFEDLHFCPTCWLDIVREPGKTDESRMELLYGWISVHPDKKKDILAVPEPLAAQEESVPISTTEFPYEYEGYGDEFFVQDNS